MPRSNTAFSILVLPVAVLFWSIGWFLYWICSRKELGRLEQRSTSNELEFFVLASEEKQAVKDTQYETLKT